MHSMVYAKGDKTLTGTRCFFLFQDLDVAYTLRDSLRSQLATSERDAATAKVRL